MPRVIDITDRLGMEGRPEIAIGDVRVKVDNTAPTMLRVLSVIGDDLDEVSPADVVGVYELIFPKKERDKLDKLELSFTDLTTVIECAIELVIGGGGEEGNAQTPATT